MPKSSWVYLKGRKGEFLQMKYGFWPLLVIFSLCLYWTTPPAEKHQAACNGCVSSQGTAFFLHASINDLQKSEKYLRNDLGLSPADENPSEPLWERSFETHPILVFLGGVMFVGGAVAFFMIISRQNKKIREGMELVRENAGRFGGGGYGASVAPPRPLQEVIKAEEEDVRSGSEIPPEKAVRKMDSVLDSLRHALGAGSRSSRLTLFRYDEPDDQFRICGVSNGEDFKLPGSAVSPPEIVFSSPLRMLTPVPQSGISLGESWIYPFGGGGGEFCVLLVEMMMLRPPDNWQDSLQGSLHLLKALIGRQEKTGIDPTLTTRDSSGSLDYRATMNRLMEELAKTKKMGIPFCMIVFRVDNLDEVEKRYGAAPLETAWSRLTAAVSSTLRPTDWVMRPRADLLMVQVLEAGEPDGQVVMARIMRSLAKYAQSKSIEKGLNFRGVLVPYPADSTLSVGTFFEQILHKVETQNTVEGTFYYS